MSSTTSSPVGIALLGAGIFAKEAHLPALAKLRDLTVLRAVYSRSTKSAQDFAKEAGDSLSLTDISVYSEDGGSSGDLDSLLTRSDIQAVIVILPITIQPGIIIRCLEAGKHVLSEKPVAASVEEGKKLIATYDANFKPRNLIWRVAENFEAEPGYRAAGAAVKEGKIGDIVTFNLAGINNTGEDSKWYKTPWRTVPDYQGGFLLDGGVHSCAALRVVLPSPLKELTGYTSLTRKYLAPQDTLTSVIKLESGAYGTFELTFASPSPALGKKRNGIVVTGTKGWLETGFTVNDQGVQVLRTILHHASGKPDIPDTEEIIEELACGVLKEIESFVKAVSGEDDGQGLGDPFGALQDVAVIQAGLNSNGNAIDLQALVA